MRKNYFLLGLAALSFTGIAFQHVENGMIESFNSKAHRNQNGSPAGRTGAPGEVTCATSSCHTGSTQAGTTENVFSVRSGVTVVTSYTPGASYNVTLQLASDPAKKGFQAVALDASNNMAGTFTGQAVGGTAVVSSGGRQYANHTGASNESIENTVWIWTWVAPATNVGDVTFYVASNKTNNSNTSAGDVIYLSQYIIGSTADNFELTKEESNFKAGYNAESNDVVMDFSSLTSGEMFFNLVDANGRSVFTYDLGKSQIGNNHASIKVPSDLRNGIYFVNVFVNNKPMSAKILVQK